MDKELKQMYWVYHDAKRRCVNPKHKRFSDYGGRGIEFRFKSFKEFLEHLGPRPLNYTLDRIDNNGHYEIGNVRWITMTEQQHNKRTYKSNTSGVKGVSFVSTLGKWVARCNESGNGKRRYLYVGKDFNKACEARQKWEDNKTSITT